MFIFLSFLSGISLFYVFGFFPATTFIAFFLAAILLLLRRKYILVLIIAIGFLYAFSRFTPPVDASALSGKEMHINCLTQSSLRELSTGRFINEATVISAIDSDTGDVYDALNGREIGIISDEGLQNSTIYEVSAKTGKDIERRNPGAAKAKRLYVYLTDVISSRADAPSGIFVFLWFQENRDRLNQYLRNNFDGDSGALISSVTTGERANMSEDLRDAFSASGLSHLLSISGTHFGLFSMMIFGIIRLIIISLPYKFLQRFTIYLTPSQAAAIISLPFMISYLIISGASIPAMRSFIMINIFLLGLLIGRKGFWLSSLLFAAFIICIWEPSALLDISFHLSFLAVLFIGIAVGDKKTSPEQGFVRRALKLIKNTTMLTVSVSLGTAPLVAYYFYYFSVVSPASNFFITPFIGFVLVPLSLVSAFVFIFTGHYPFQPFIAVISELAIKGVKLSASVPFADIKIPAFPLIAILVFYSGLSAYLLSGRGKTEERGKYALIPPVISTVIFLALLIPWGKNMSVTYLDVGQGDSAVIEASGRTIAIDTGRTGNELHSHLRYLGKKSIDALILTHADADHSAGALSVISRFNVKELWDNGLIMYPEGFMKNLKNRHLERGDDINSGGLRIQVLHPYKGFYTLEGNEAFSENNSSLVLKITGEKKSFLFTADTAEEAEDDMLHLGEWLKSDVIKVSHHGSRTSSAEYFLKAVSPEAAVISVGRYNPYGHPHRETMERLEGMKIYRTDIDGAVKFTETHDGLSVRTYKDFHFERTRNLSGEWRNIMRLFARW